MPPRAKRGRKALTASNEKEPLEVTQEPKRSRKAKENAKMAAQPSKKRKPLSEELENEVVKDDVVMPSTKRRKGNGDGGIEETDRMILTTRPKSPSPTTKMDIETATESQTISHHSHGNAPGQVMTLGQGDVGQLGLGEEVMERKKPFPVGGALAEEKVVQVVCGGMHTVALTDEGKVYSWGCNDESALGRKAEEGEEFVPGLVGKLEQVKVVQVSAGDSHTAALASNGNVYCWGVFRDSNGPFGLVKNKPSTLPELVYSTPFNKAVKIVSGSDHVVILTEQGDVLTFGCGEQGQLGRVPECFTARGGRKGLSMLLHPQVIRFRKLRGFPKPKFNDIFCGSYHTFALTWDRGVYAWGLNNYGQLGTDDNENRFQPERLPSNWIEDNVSDSESRKLEISGGQHHSLLCRNGGVYVMGRKEYGRLGLGENSEELQVPKRLPSLTDVKSVAAGTVCSFAVTESGEVYSWGMGTNLQLGTGEEDDSWTPVKITGKKIENRRILSASAGGQHTALLVSRQEEPVE